MLNSLTSSSTLLNISRQSLRRACANRGSTKSSACSSILQVRFYSALSPEEEEKEKQRVSVLSKRQKEIELSQLDKDIARLNTLRGINNGELYTFRGKFKALSRDYGLAFIAWYWCVWTSSAFLTYGAIELGGIDAIELLTKVDDFTGYDLSSKVDPTIGTIGLTIAVNELLEPLRLPIVVFTTKPIVDAFNKNKY
mmetsp:Transcript_6228/g.7891  ORF Transcript_6228/g.7891 Transcript_6228/m.7891 type:complete len:196 (+) Transcript_6228:73-660(+)